MIINSGFDYSSPLRHFVKILANGTREERVNLTILDSVTATYFSNNLESISSMMPDAKESKAFTSISILTRYLWSLVPRELFETQYPDFKKLARNSIISKFGLSNISEFDILISDLSKIFKRIRLVYKEGRRNAKSLNLDNSQHLELFKIQNKRCALCAYEFEINHHRFELEEDGMEAFPYNKLENEIVLHHATFRTPELDHIIPYVLGGDSSNNWQILCKSCNIGKSDYINYMYAFSSQSTHRLSDLESLTYGNRYAVIASTSQKLDSSSIQISDGRYYRIFKNNDDGFLDSMNLKSEYC